MVLIIVVIIVALIVWILFSRFMKQHLLKQCLNDLKKQQFKEYDEKLNSLLYRYFFPTFNREYMRLNGFVFEGDKQKVEDQFDNLLSMRMGKNQEKDIVSKAFYYYIDDSNKRMSKKLLERLKLIVDQASIQEYQIIYDVVIEKSTSYIEVMEQALLDSSISASSRGMFHYMIGLQYSNLKQMKKCKEYLRKAQPDLKNTPYEYKIKLLLK